MTTEFWEMTNALPAANVAALKLLTSLYNNAVYGAMEDGTREWVGSIKINANAGGHISQYANNAFGASRRQMNQDIWNFELAPNLRYTLILKYHHSNSYILRFSIIDERVPARAAEEREQALASHDEPQATYFEEDGAWHVNLSRHFFIICEKRGRDWDSYECKLFHRFPGAEPRRIGLVYEKYPIKGVYKLMEQNKYALAEDKPGARPAAPQSAAPELGIAQVVYNQPAPNGYQALIVQFEGEGRWLIVADRILGGKLGDKTWHCTLYKAGVSQMDFNTAIAMKGIRYLTVQAQRMALEASLTGAN